MATALSLMVPAFPKTISAETVQKPAIEINEEVSLSNEKSISETKAVENSNISWTIELDGDRRILIISGTGAVPSYSAGGTDAPWHDLDVTEIKIRQGITQIGLNAFASNTSVTKLYLPLSLDIAVPSAFEGCPIKEIYYTGTLTALNNIAGLESLLASNVLRYTANSCGYCNTEKTIVWSFYQDDSLNGILGLSGSGAITDYATYEEVPWYRYSHNLITVSIEKDIYHISRKGFECLDDLQVFECENGGTFESYVPGNQEVSINGKTSCALINKNDQSLAFPVVGKGYKGSSFNHLVLPRTLVHIDADAFEGIETLPDLIVYAGDSAGWASTAIEGNEFLNTVTVYYPYEQASVSGSILAQGNFGNGVRWHYYSSMIDAHIYSTDLRFLGHGVIPDFTPSSDTPIQVYNLESQFGVDMKLEHINVEEGITSIGQFGFAGFDGVSNIYLPRSLETLGMGVFAGDTEVRGVHVDGNDHFCVDEEGVLFTKDKKELIYYPGQKIGYSYTVPEGVTTIRTGAFCDQLDSNRDFGFYLTSISLPRSLTEIQYAAFAGYVEKTDEESISCLKKVLYDGTAAQFNQISIGELNDSLMVCLERNEGPLFTHCGDNVTWSVDGTALILSGNGPMWNLAAEIPLPINLKSKETKAIGRSTEYSETYFGSLQKPWHEYEEQISKVLIQEGVETIGEHSFTSLTELKNIFLPVSLSSIGYGAFADSGENKYVYYAGTETDKDEITGTENLIGRDNRWRCENHVLRITSDLGAKIYVNYEGEAVWNLEPIISGLNFDVSINVKPGYTLKEGKTTEFTVTTGSEDLVFDPMDYVDKDPSLQRYDRIFAEPDYSMADAGLLTVKTEPGVDMNVVLEGIDNARLSGKKVTAELAGGMSGYLSADISDLVSVDALQEYYSMYLSIRAGKEYLADCLTWEIPVNVTLPLREDIRTEVSNGSELKVVEVPKNGTPRLITANLTPDGNSVSFTCSQAAEYAITAEKSPLSEYQMMHSCSFNNNLTLNYYAPVIDGAQNVYLTLQKRKYNADGSKYTWTEETLESIEIRNNEGTDYYHFAFNGIAAKEMNDEIKAVFHATINGREYTAPVDYYSVSTYASNLINPAQENKELYDLLVDMLKYGSAAQTYFNYNTSHPAYDILSMEQRQYGTFDELTLVDHNEVIETPENVSARFIGKTVVFDSNIKLRYYMQFDSGEPGEDVKLVLNYTTASGTPASVTINSIDFAYNSTHQAYTADLSQLAAKDLGTVVTAQIFDGDIPVSNKTEFTVETYAKYWLENASSSDALKELVSTMMKYSKSAKAYLTD